MFKTPICANVASSYSDGRAKGGAGIKCSLGLRDEGQYGFELAAS